MRANELISKLEYLGLNLNKIPNFIEKMPIIDEKSINQITEKNYKVYRYLNVKDISIMLTPANRLTDFSSKFSKAGSLFAYLKEENRDYFEKIVEIIRDTRIEEIEKIENNQKEMNKQIPIKVKFSKDYLWQIHYSEEKDQYFMLVPTEEKEFAAFLYLLKKQLQKSKDKIFVPVCNKNYSKEYLHFKEINDLENYLYFFTKEWPMIYEVYDKENKSTLQIIGKTPVFANIKSDYKFVIESKEDAVKMYKLIKALFLLQSELPYYFKFDIQVDEKGNIHFIHKEKEIEYKNLSKFIQEEYEVAKNSLKEIEQINVELEKLELKLKKEEKSLNKEFFLKQKQISTFLECKKTFMGRVKYFFKYGKKNKIVVQNEKEQENIKITSTPKIEFAEKISTVDTLTSICKVLIDKTNKAKLRQLDTEKIKTKIDIIKKKIENANLYIQEIEEHRKSIFDFWKFTSKDEADQLNEGFANIEKEIKIKRSFNLNSDFAEVANLIDSKQRNILTREETNSIYICTTNVFEDIKRILKGKKILKKSLENLKVEWKNYQEQGLNIFGDETEEFKILANKKHREIERNKFAILEINETTTIEEYTENLKKVIKNIEKAFAKAKLELDIPVYAFGQDNIEEPLGIFYINPSKIIENTEEDIKLYILNLKRNIDTLGFSNIVYYNNTNKTLPVGMNVSTGILLKTENLEMKLKENKTKNVLTFDENSNKIKVIKLNIFEYDL